MHEALSVLVTGKSLSREQSSDLFRAILSGQTEPEQIAAALALIQSRGVTVDELIGAATVMRQHVTPVPVDESFRSRLIDTCGTGGAPKTFNISTAAAIIAAAAANSDGEQRMLVAKHGNRSRTGRGSAEVLAQLGINIDASPEQQSRCLEMAGICFCFAIHHHPAMRFAAGPRKALGFPTIFNLLGPLINPAKPDFQLVGLHDPASLPLYAQALGGLGRKRAWAVHGSGPAGFRLDELSTCGPSLAHEAGCPRPFTIDPAALGLPMARPSDLEGGDAPANARIILDLLEGKDRGPRRDIVCLNAAAALMVCGVAADWPEGLHMAGDAMDSGAASGKLTALRATA